MCNIKDGFRLCTCAIEESTPTADAIGWELKRVNLNLPLHHRKGKAVIPRYNTSEQSLQTLILDNLNKGNCFDFDYSPQANDYLKVKGSTAHNNAKWFRYCYSDKKQQWQIDTSDSLAAWKTQLESLNQGKIVD